MQMDYGSLRFLSSTDLQKHRTDLSVLKSLLEQWSCIIGVNKYLCIEVKESRRRSWRCVCPRWVCAVSPPITPSDGWRCYEYEVDFWMLMAADKWRVSPSGCCFFTGHRRWKMYFLCPTLCSEGHKTVCLHFNFIFRDFWALVGLLFW